MLVLERAGWHSTPKLPQFPNVSLLPLPAGSPELNPAEMLWRELRQRYLSNRLYPDIYALDDALGSAWLRLSDDTQRLRQLTNFSWIDAAVAQSQRTPGTS